MSVIKKGPAKINSGKTKHVAEMQRLRAKINKLSENNVLLNNKLNAIRSKAIIYNIDTSKEFIKELKKEYKWAKFATFSKTGTITLYECQPFLDADGEWIHTSGNMVVVFRSENGFLVNI